MITIKDFMEAIEYRITEGSDFCWSCFGPNAYRLDSWNGEQDGYTVSITFDTQTQEVYQAEAYDYENNRAYRLQNPAYIEAHNLEAASRDIDPQEALDDVKFIDLDVDSDFLEKVSSIVAGEEYDTRVQVPINLEKDEMYQLMLIAHERDITFNELAASIIQQAIELSKEENNV